MRNGYEPRRRALRGLGSLSIHNGTDDDAIVWLSPDGREDVARQVFVARQRAATVSDIASGLYRIRYEKGTTYLRARGRFCHSGGAFEFDDLVTFDERQNGGTTRYHVYELTLEPVPGGTARVHNLLVALPNHAGDSLIQAPVGP